MTPVTEYLADSREKLTLTAKVVVLAPVPEALDYAVPDGMDIAIGDHVVVPLGHAKVRGLVIGLIREAIDFPLKPILSKPDDPPVPENSLHFWLWAANWTVTPPGTFLNGCLRALKVARAQVRLGYVRTGIEPARITKARERVIETAILPMGLGELALAAGVSEGVVTGLAKEGVLEKVALPFDDRIPQPDPDFAPARLNPSQSAAHQLLQMEMAKGFAPVLLDGVTGSGKTEVYLESVADVLRADPAAQVLILLPEIALTQAVLGRLKARFGVEVAQWHANIGNSSRRRIWEGVATGKIRLVVGARSALFLPYVRLGLIVIDEEHDSSYKQEEGVRYHARDLAVFRARMDGAMVVMASATPSLETLTNAEKERYTWIRLEKRHGTAVLPDIELIDMKAHAPGKGQKNEQMWLSDILVAEVWETLKRREQVLLFLNRRGYAPLVLCKACGEKMSAPNTDSWLVEHRSSGRLVCHLTGFSMRKPKICPHCKAVDSLVSVGPGVERILEEVQSRFPDARAEVFSSDTVPDAASSAALIRRIEDHDIDIVIATQAAAKGHNFPNLTLVGIVDADLGLKGGDLRAAERTFQLLQQATGRAGRSVKPGKALLQTYTPEHPVMQALAHQDREAFYAYEGMSREMAGFPPYGRLAALILQAKDQKLLDRFSRELALFIPNTDGIDVYGPADAPLALVRGQWRKRFLVRADRNRDLQGFVNHWLAAIKRPNAIRLIVDIEPYSFL
ncbi:primosomal protein N [Asticcacaulis biprosthecium C19]|uniref:Replication restart protein PriA n=1 Tax=Asticcacaulis biprosthecium C19 TaxID=715226 RepID=F4QL10_9CAUL|nr:primosomal protein N' [Asticcacaulis biprosthecium]EGF92233.1 primosomal protein N [Asticcacaulis biprosthecium C19]